MFMDLDWQIVIMPWSNPIFLLYQLHEVIKAKVLIKQLPDHLGPILLRPDLRCHVYRPKLKILVAFNFLDLAQLLDKSFSVKVREFDTIFVYALHQCNFLMHAVRVVSNRIDLGDKKVADLWDFCIEDTDDVWLKTICYIEKSRFNLTFDNFGLFVCSLRMAWKVYFSIGIFLDVLRKHLLVRCLQFLDLSFCFLQFFSQLHYLFHKLLIVRTVKC